MYLTDIETNLQNINKWIGVGSKLNLAKTADADVLKVIVIKLQERLKAGTATLLIKVKVHRGDPLNEESDIRAEMSWGFMTYRGISKGYSGGLDSLVL